MEAKKLIREYKKSKIYRKNLEKERDKERENLKKREDEITDKFWKKEREIGEQKTKEFDKISKDKNKMENHFEPLFEESYRPIDKLKRTIELLLKEIKIKENPNLLKLSKKSIGHYEGSDKFIEYLGGLYNDNFLKINCLITINNKPKNCYSLVVYGRCLFGGEDFIKFPKSYGVHLRDEWLSILYVIKDSPEKKELKKLLEKSKEKILETCKVSEYEELKKEYLETIESHKIEDFEQFKTFKNWRILDEEEQEKVKSYVKKNKIKLSEIDNQYLEDKRDFESWYEENRDKFNFKRFDFYSF